MSTAVQTETATVPASLQLADVSLDTYDEEQVRLMEERCILVTPDDVVYGDSSKKVCHLMTNINKGLLHRAFSVFLFRPSDGRLLLQKRADEKITFPSMWTNTCCSHPLSIKSELIEEDQAGAKNAAIRKLPQELGIPESQLKYEDFVFLTRIHYLAPSDGIWGEHEIDYILFSTINVDHEANPNEVSDARYVSKSELEDMFADPSNSFTPWFRLIARDLLFPWWDEMFAKSKAAGWDAEKGVGEVRADHLANGPQVNELIRML
ncbi:isopentenyl-diphosphate Delta-isomerase [Cryptococcus wingfieldii CBS 7118]|uniref:isopentenyl-diphosphate Delta-isomerase n=1 Tax=Cryptococcus wingfieldii CBS 7118 TaxID=1295528 RepID=A0A1E3J0V0_9TREE|nr:isopentenyl-diphosphate Delta-isomerase [Cryptococcus wingfieldii CBS 7118]ODN94285.1 isopentenyl-diphosphate Delta-isomerase [Cryptococcus wingfieldii CBS 7118]